MVRLITRTRIGDNITSKKGQFYILSAIIIVFVISGLSGIVTYTNIKKEPRSINEISEDLRIETPKVIDYGLYSGQDITSLVDNFTNNDFMSYYSSKTGEDTNLTFIYGNEEGGYSARKWQKKSTGKLSFGSAEWKVEEMDAIIVDTKIEEDTNNPEIKYVTIAGEKYSFELKPGSTFYFLLKHQEGNETIIKRSDDKIK